MKKTMEFWFSRQLEKIEQNLQEIQQESLISSQTNQIIHKIQKYKQVMPWKNGSPHDFSIATTPFSNYSKISSNSLTKSVNHSLNNAFYMISSQKLHDFDGKIPENLNKLQNESNNLCEKSSNLQFFKEKMTVSQKEELFLKLINTKASDNDVVSRHSVKLEDILNVTKNANESSVDCEFLKGVDGIEKLAYKRKLPQNSLEKLLKTFNFTGKLSEISIKNSKKSRKKIENAFFERNTLDEKAFDEKVFDEKSFDEKSFDEKVFDKKAFDEKALKESFFENDLKNLFEENDYNEENPFEESLKIVKDLNREIYQYLEENLDLSESFKSQKKKNIQFLKKKGKKIPLLDLAKLKKKENTHSFSPSYRKNAERTQYLKEIFAEKPVNMFKKTKQTNKSMDFSNKPINFGYFQSRINEQTNKFIKNLMQNPKKHLKNNYSLIENSNKEEIQLSFVKNNYNNIKISELFKKNEEENEGKSTKNQLKTPKNPITNKFKSPKNQRQKTSKNLLKSPENQLEKCPKIHEEKPTKIEEKKTMKIQEEKPLKIPKETIVKIQKEKSPNTQKEKSPLGRAFQDKTNFLNILAPTNNFDVFISGEFEEKEGFNSNPSTRPKRKANIDNSLGNIMGALKEKDKNKEDFSFLQKMRKKKGL